MWAACAEARRPRKPKSHHQREALSTSNRPCPGITLRCNHSTSHVGLSVGAPQGIEIAPARTPERFSAPKRPRSVTFHENFDFPKIWSMHKALVFIQSSRCGQRRALISSEDQAMTYWSCLILRDFHLKRLCES